MRAIVWVVSGLLSVTISVGAYAHNSEKPAGKSKAVKVAQEANAPAAQAAEISPVSPEMLMFSVVKIHNNVANIFKPELEGSHGTGFFIGANPINPSKGLIFTNKHVIDSEALQAQSLVIEFNTNDPIPEPARGKLIYVSPVHDFAVLEFDPAQLKRAELRFPLQLPQESSPFRDYIANARHLRGVETLAIGNPLNGENIVSYGEITGLQMDPFTGPFIQTQTPINPGNSGGPLIVKETGEVVGINTAIIANANNIGYATPVGTVMDEFLLWLNQKAKNVRPDASEPRLIPFKMLSITETTLDVVGRGDAFKKALPNYWNSHRSALMITDVTDQGTEFQKDDILLSINGNVVGGYPYSLMRGLQQSAEFVDVKVLRKNEVVDLKVRFQSTALNSARQDLDFVYLSGIVFREMGIKDAGRAQVGVKSRVVVGGMVDSAETSFRAGNFPYPGSIISSVSFGGDEYPVVSLLDLKKAINANRDKTYIQLRVYSANLILSDDTPITVTSPRTGQPLLDGQLSTYIVPMREVLTPLQFSIHQFKKQFSFKQTDSHTWDWREFRQPERLPTGCADLLAGKKK